MIKDGTLDICACGDFRRDHEDGNGPCDAFQFSRVASQEEIAQQHGLTEWLESQATASSASDAPLHDIAVESSSSNDYLRGGCTDSECRLCHLASYARKPGMRHAGIPSASIGPVSSDAVGLNLFRQLISGSNALRDLDVFRCNDVEHDDGCKCFWEQCEAWAIADAAASRGQSGQRAFIELSPLKPKRK